MRPNEDSFLESLEADEIGRNAAQGGVNVLSNDGATISYIPKGPVLEHLRKIQDEHRIKVEKYKELAQNLRTKYTTFEGESQRHYARIIK